MKGSTFNRLHIEIRTLPAREHSAVFVFFFSSLQKFVLVTHELIKQMIYDVGREDTNLKIKFILPVYCYKTRKVGMEEVYRMMRR